MRAQVTPPPGPKPSKLSCAEGSLKRPARAVGTLTVNMPAARPALHTDTNCSSDHNGRAVSIVRPVAKQPQ